MILPFDFIFKRLVLDRMQGGAQDWESGDVGSSPTPAAALPHDLG